MILKVGTEILIKAKVVGLAPDDRPADERGYIVETNPELSSGKGVCRPSRYLCHSIGEKGRRE